MHSISIVGGAIMSKETCIKEQRSLLKTLDRALHIWYGLKRADIPKVLSKIGISGEHSMEVVDVSNSTATIKISSDGKNYSLEINRGDMINPYPSWCLSADGIKTYYRVDSNLKVEKICSFDSKGKLEFELL